MVTGLGFELDDVEIGRAFEPSLTQRGRPRRPRGRHRAQPLRRETIGIRGPTDAGDASQWRALLVGAEKTIAREHEGDRAIGVGRALPRAQGCRLIQRLLDGLRGRRRPLDRARVFGRTGARLADPASDFAVGNVELFAHGLREERIG